MADPRPPLIQMTERNSLNVWDALPTHYNELQGVRLFKAAEPEGFMEKPSTSTPNQQASSHQPSDENNGKKSTGRTKNSMVRIIKNNESRAQAQGVKAGQEGDQTDDGITTTSKHSPAPGLKALLPTGQLSTLEQSTKRKPAAHDLRPDEPKRPKTLAQHNTGVLGLVKTNGTEANEAEMVQSKKKKKKTLPKGQLFLGFAKST